MDMLQLGIDEVVLFKSQEISFTSSLWGKGDGIITLTNKRVVIQTAKGFLKKTTINHEDRIENIKIYEGNPQVIMQKVSFGDNPLVDVYFRDNQVTIEFYSNRKDAKEFVYQSCKLLGNPEKSGMEGADSTKAFAIPGTDKLAKTLKGTIATFKDTFANVAMVSDSCPNCSGQVTGYKGKAAKCPFCGNIIKL